MLSLLTFACLALCVVSAQKGGQITEIGDTQVSAMMLFVGNEDKAYILDKMESNAAHIDGHPTWGVEWDLASNKAKLMPLTTNTFCAAGMHFPNGSWATFGGNMAIAPPCATGFCEPPIDADGATAVRILTPCPSGQDCQWTDNHSLNLVKKRWYPGIEALGDGSVVLIGGFVNGGYINRNYPNTDPLYEGGAAEPTFEFWPPRSDEPQVMQFMGKTSGLNSYAHAYLMPSGKMFVQANISTIMWDVDSNQETPLPDMPNKIARVYPASAATAMLPLTPENHYIPTILFCGGISLRDDQWGNYVFPAVDVFNIPNSNDCQRITPEPLDGSPVQYQKDDDMLETRSMGQFIILPDETLLVVNGGSKGTAGYAMSTGQTTYGSMPFGMSLSSAPVLTPAVYNPTAPAGSRWSNTGFQASTIPRLYHSSAVLLPDASVMIAGSNPNIDVNASAIYPTTYRAEKFYPSYFNAAVRPDPKGIPKNLAYGGKPFDITYNTSSFDASKLNPNSAAVKTKVIVIRPGFSTHAMNMGQKALRLNTTYSVADSGTVTIHCSQMPPNANLFQPGPAFLYVVIDGIPSSGSMVIIGNGMIGKQDVDATLFELPASSYSTKFPTESNTESEDGNEGKGAAMGFASQRSGALMTTLAIAAGAVLF